MPWYVLPRSGACYYSEAPLAGLEPAEEPVVAPAAPAPQTVAKASGKKGGA
jgi:hypothetical protein